MIKSESSLGSNFEKVVFTAGEFIISGKNTTLLVGTAGVLSCIGADTTDKVTDLPVPIGYNPISCKKILEAGTTADNIWVLR